MLSQHQFVHHVYFWLQNPSSREDAAKLLQGLQSLTAVDSIESFHIGVPADTSREVIETTYQFSWLAIFESKELQEQYQVDPIHLKFVEDCSHLWQKVVVYDSVNAI